MKRHRETPAGQLPGSLGSGQPGADDMDQASLLRGRVAKGMLLGSFSTRGMAEGFEGVACCKRISACLGCQLVKFSLAFVCPVLV